MHWCTSGYDWFWLHPFQVEDSQLDGMAILAGRQHAYKCEAIHQQYTGVLPLSLCIICFDHTPSWMKYSTIFALLDACSHVYGRHGYIGRQHAYKCEAIHRQYIGVLTLFEGITVCYHTPPWWKYSVILWSMYICGCIGRYNNKHAYKRPV